MNQKQYRVFSGIEASEINGHIKGLEEKGYTIEIVGITASQGSIIIAYSQTKESNTNENN